VENGSIYIFKPDVLRTTHNCLGGRIAMYEMDFWKTWKIDSLEDKALCEWYFMNVLMKRIVNLAPSAIDLIVYDFDGVMTDNRVLTLQDGTEAVFANRSDGLAISLIGDMGIKQVIISMETNPVVRARAEKVGIQCLQGIGDKLNILKKYLAEQNIDKDKVAFIGNEINDVAAMSYVGLPVAPADAYPEAKNVAKIVLKTKGGDGVVREFFDLIKRGAKDE
jgi:YrbI family 3-deoxy-D-manno-octulosonate 8-phosphate phosphatase